MKIPENKSNNPDISTDNQLPLPPGNLGLPIIGETISFLTDKNFINKRQEKYGNVFKTNMFGIPTIVMIGADANRFIFSGENRNFTVRQDKNTSDLLGPVSLAMQTGSIHQTRRKLLAQAFQTRALASYTPAMVEITNSYLQKWKDLGQLALYPQLREYAFDIACKLLVGTDITNDHDFHKLFEAWCQGLHAIPIRLPWTMFSKAVKSRKLLLAKIDKIIVERQKQPSLENSEKDALDLLLNAKDENGNSLSVDEIKDQILGLLFVGHEALSSVLFSFCLLLAENPEILVAARQEQQQINCTGDLTAEHFKQMTYLDQILKEILRLIPPILGGFRSVIKTCEFNGYSIPEGWVVVYDIYKTHEDENIYQNPQSFDPDRFSVERNEDKSKPFSYIPFGGGIKECLGKEFAKLEMKIFTALLLRGYEWELVPGQNSDSKMTPMPQSSDGLKVFFKKLDP
ncbi:cytochrome P450 [Sphaerospermopsis sp. FACHB-1194]|uniref:cytochrome P450 n=1 Tax=Sphaerospermopsis sp. FACHB-1194 TaxID=2692862 RepID=UPI00167FE64D|nr:cytochrome P450 [Sphaerospermopsis sp. FACHB-1194]MBD2145673.1 cytochrome P450 [Sphaerospermopsis sp. FACHB-1194]